MWSDLEFESPVPHASRVKGFCFCPSFCSELSLWVRLCTAIGWNQQADWQHEELFGYFCYRGLLRQLKVPLLRVESYGPWSGETVARPGVID